MYPNLRAEMARYRISTLDLAKVLKVCRKSINNKMTGKTEFYLDEALIIKNTFFPDSKIDALFEKEDHPNSQGAA